MDTRTVGPATGRATSGAGPAARRADGLLDVTVAALAWWTVVYHVALLLELSRDPTIAVFGVGLPFVIVLAARPVRDPVRPGPRGALATTGSGRAVLVAVLAGAGLAAVFTPAGAAFVPVWAGIIVTAVVGVTLARRPARRPAAVRRDLPDWAAWMLAALALAGALFILRPDPEDVEVVNKAIAIEIDDGPFPTRDTVLSDEVWAGDRPNTPATSIEALHGIVAAIVPWRAPTVVYLWYGPLVGLLSVLALWRLLRTLGATVPVLATGLAMAFLFLDGELHSGFGNFWLGRIWQGKTALVVVAVPLLWHHAVTWARDGHRRSLFMAAVTAIAAVGLSRTGVFVAALVIVPVAGAALALRRPDRAATSVLALAYPAAAGAFWLVAEGEPVAPRLPGAVTAFLTPVLGAVLPETDPAYAWYTAIGNGGALALALGGALAAFLLVQDRFAAAALALAPAAVAVVTSTPGSLERLDDLTGSDSILWRSVWAIPVAAAVGLLLSGPALLSRASHRWTAGVLVPVLALGLHLGDGRAVVDRDNKDARFAMPSWKVDPDDLAAARRLEALSETGALVAAPVEVGWALGSTTLTVRTVTPRVETLIGRHVVPEMLADERLSLAFSLQDGALDTIAVDLARRALTALPVSTVCSRPAVDENAITDVLRETGFGVVEVDEHCVYWRRGA